MSKARRDPRMREIRKGKDGRWYHVDDGTHSSCHPCARCGRTEICDKCAVRIACLFKKQGELEL